MNDSSLLTFLNGLNLKATQKEALNIKLVKVRDLLLRFTYKSLSIKNFQILAHSREKL